MAPTKPLSGWNPNEPAYWWVNQKAPSFRQERVLGCVWAPKTDKRGRPLKQYVYMQSLKPGHVVFHYSDKAVRALSRVVEAATDAPPPAGGQHGPWSEVGNSVRVEYHDLPRPIPLHEIPVDWRVGEGGPFNTTGAVKLLYLSPLSSRFAEQVLEHFGLDLPPEQPHRGPDEEVPPATRPPQGEVHALPESEHIGGPRSPLAGVSIGNFKAFAATQFVPIRPITLVFGPNSSGKSSLIHALALIHEANRTGRLDVHKTQIGGSAVDLGGFRQYVHRGEARRRVELGFRLDAARVEGRLGEILAPVKDLLVSTTLGIALDDHDEPVVGAQPEVLRFELGADGATLLQMSRRPDASLRLDRLDHTHKVFCRVIEAMVQAVTTTDYLSPADYRGIEGALADIIPHLSSAPAPLFPSSVQGKPRVGGDLGAPALFPISRGNRQEDLAAALELFLPRTLGELLQRLSELLNAQLARFRYLGPLRSFPPRHLAFAEHEDVNWFAGGGYAWDVVRRDKTVREKVNAWLGDRNRLKTPYELVIRHLTTIEALESEYYNFVNDLEERFAGGDYGGDLFGEIQGALSELNEEAHSQVQELILVDKRTETRVSHRDVGIGVSQVLPVLVGAYASKDQIIAIEQPEIHLHPALQAELGDVFIESALGPSRNTFILETHSEHLILRLLKRIRDASEGHTPAGLPSLRPEDVSVVYVQPTAEGSTVQVIGVTEDGEFDRPWPEGFFAERAKELM